MSDKMVLSHFAPQIFIAIHFYSVMIRFKCIKEVKIVPNRAIGRNIRQFRTEKGLSQEDLAALLFVTRQTVSNYETGDAFS